MIAARVSVATLKNSSGIPASRAAFCRDQPSGLQFEDWLTIACEFSLIPDLSR